MKKIYFFAFVANQKKVKIIHNFWSSIKGQKKKTNAYFLAFLADRKNTANMKKFTFQKWNLEIYKTLINGDTVIFRSWP